MKKIKIGLKVFIIILCVSTYTHASFAQEKKSPDSIYQKLFNEADFVAIGKVGELFDFITPELVCLNIQKQWKSSKTASASTYECMHPKALYNNFKFELGKEYVVFAKDLDKKEILYTSNQFGSRLSKNCEDLILFLNMKTKCQQKEKQSSACPRAYDWVCGCDGTTYNSPCDAHRNGIDVWVSGECEE